MGVICSCLKKAYALGNIFALGGLPSARYACVLVCPGTPGKLGLERFALCLKNARMLVRLPAPGYLGLA